MLTKLNIHPSWLINVAATILAYELNEEITLLAYYKEYKDVFLNKNAYILLKHAPHNHAIELIEGKQPPWKPIYLLLEEELAVLWVYINQHIKTRFIWPSQSLASAPILFVKKPRGGLCLYIDYKGLNNMTIKNYCLLSLVGEFLDWLGHAKKYTQLNLTAIYHCMRIQKNNEWKTAFCTWYEHFEYQMLPFGLANAPASFQAYINRALT